LHARGKIDSKVSRWAKRGVSRKGEAGIFPFVRPSSRKTGTATDSAAASATYRDTGVWPGVIGHLAHKDVWYVTDDAQIGRIVLA
jgi:hypothetical protein